jgi:phage/plasmid-like protein (TIGR03299 family)
MSHNIEVINDKYMMAYAGDTPWHGLGTKVPNDLTSDQMLEAAGLDWTVEMVPAFANIGGTDVGTGHSALVRNLDNKILDVVSNDWNPVQNKDAFDFFNEFITAGDMEMHTAGSLKEGQIVWALARVKQSFELFKGDQIDSYLLFSNFHKYGFSTDVRFTPIRVVCNNTLSLALNNSVERMAKFSHRKIFKPEHVKSMLGIATNKLEKYKNMADFLGSKKAKDEDIVEYFNRIFPLTSNKAGSEKKISKNAKIAMDILHTQPGSEFAEGTWWQPFNSVTFITDHITGRSTDSRLSSAWYGQNKNLKNKALELAIEMAEAS